MEMTPALRRILPRLRRSDGTIPIATVSGVASTTVGMIKWFDTNTDVAMITTKSFQITPNPGNREPIITEPQPGSFGNAVGLRNPGIVTAVRELVVLRRRRTLRALLNVSVSGRSVEDFVDLAATTAPVADLIELNYSCPHATAGYGADIGKDIEAISEITRATVASVPGVPVLVKLTPNVPDIAVMARAAIEAGAAGVVAINTVGPRIYREPDSGAPILMNPPDGRGGASGAWIAEDARRGVASIRDAIGTDPLIIGMGGVATVADCRALHDAGADTVGVGSALARVSQRDWPAYLTRLGEQVEPVEPERADEAPAPARSKSFLRSSAEMAYSPAVVTDHRELAGGLFELTIARSLPFGPGQVVFLWLPGIGEKPFSPALSNPATFLIKRRGPVTTALGALHRGDRVYIRGPYGASHEIPTNRDVHGDTDEPATRVPSDPSGGRGMTPRTLLVAGGSGAAILPSIARKITDGGGSVVCRIGVTEPFDESTVVHALQKKGAVEIIPDKGVPGRVLETLEGTVTTDRFDLAYLVGPDPFMKRGVHLIETRSPVTKIFVSLEQSMRCGVGMCGECHNRGMLTCNSGTIIPAEDWEASDD
ncbi:MAG: dihydroorotate dehydrogenase [Alkalispirochaeta sp.]